MRIRIGDALLTEKTSEHLLNQMIATGYDEEEAFAAAYKGQIITKDENDFWESGLKQFRIHSMKTIAIIDSLEYELTPDENGIIYTKQIF